VKILLDTHIFIWAIMGDPRLTQAQRELYTDKRNELFLSVVSVWEIVLKAGLGKLRMPVPAVSFVARQLKQNRISLLAIHLSHLAALETLPPLHRDPFDRLLVAQAKAEGMTILSVDSKLPQYGVSVLPENLG
jgi:PIN domain nuclease of toxin-antitoxin system